MNDIEMWGDWCSGWGPLCRQPQTIERVRDLIEAHLAIEREDADRKSTRLNSSH